MINSREIIFRHLRTTMTRSQQPVCRFKILLIGDSSVGKTSLMFRFADDKFTETYTSTIGVDFKTKTLDIQDKIVELQMWDTAGQEKFFNIVRSYYRNADAILLIYDRTEARSFQHIVRWMSTIRENAPEDVIRVLVANKSDLHHRIVISTQDGKRLADESHVDFFETSAKSDSYENISQIFLLILEKLLEKKQLTVKKETIKINEADNPSYLYYGNLIGCCSSTSIEK